MQWTAFSFESALLDAATSYNRRQFSMDIIKESYVSNHQYIHCYCNRFAWITLEKFLKWNLPIVVRLLYSPYSDSSWRITPTFEAEIYTDALLWFKLQSILWVKWYYLIWHTVQVLQAIQFFNSNKDWYQFLFQRNMTLNYVLELKSYSTVFSTEIQLYE